jgi:hypothetical protein
MSFFRRAGAAIARIFQSAADPAAEPDKVLLYSKDAAGVSQLFARSDDGTVHQITPGGGGAVTTDASLSGDGTVPTPLSTNPWNTQSLAGPLVVFTGSQRPTNQFRFFNDMMSGYTGFAGATGVVALGESNLGLGSICYTQSNLTATGDFAVIVPYPQKVLTGCQMFATKDCTRLGFDARVRVAGAAQSATTDREVQIGMSDQMLPIGLANRAMRFEASWTKYGDNNWHAYLRSGLGPTQTVNTGISMTPAGPAVQWHRFTVVYDRATTSVYYYYDGALVATLVEPDLNVNGLNSGPVVGQNGTLLTPALYLVQFDWVDIGADIDRSVI